MGLAARECRWCFCTFTPVHRGGKARYCSDPCRYAAANHRRFHTDLHSSPVRWGECVACGRPFVRRMAYWRACPSVECRARFRWLRDRARFAERHAVVSGGERVSIADLVERDGPACRLCGEAVDLEAKWPAPMSPSKDHKIPITRGGMHVADNLQLAHLYCNTSKGNRD